MSNYGDTLPYENEDKQLWDPTRLSEEVTKEYLNKAAETLGANGVQGVNGIPNGSHIRDDEQVGVFIDEQVRMFIDKRVGVFIEEQIGVFIDDHVRGVHRRPCRGCS